MHAFRRSVGEQCLKANKHVLLEKPFACKAEDAEYLMGLAKERNLFLMEGKVVLQLVFMFETCFSYEVDRYVDKILSSF